MCKGLGLDLCGIPRMEPLLADGRFLARYFTGEEAAYIRSRGAGAAQSMAGIWAAKEALLKAAGRGLSLPLAEIEVCHDPSGQPFYRLHGTAAEALPGAFLLSITHEGDMAAAVCLWTAD
ncbi:MAG: holo-ACP synthase [Aristaeellaceae bacterium]